MGQPHDTVRDRLEQSHEVRVGSSYPDVSEDMLVLPPPCAWSPWPLCHRSFPSRAPEGNVQEASGSQLLAASEDRD